MSTKQPLSRREDPSTASSSSGLDSDSEDEQLPSPQRKEEVEQVSEQEEDDDDDEEKEVQSPASISHPKPSSSSESEEETESENESESESHDEPANSKVTHLASKPMDENTKAQAQASSKIAAKRALSNSNGDVSDSKRAKKDTTLDDGKKSVDDWKKQFQRLWNEEDEIAIVKGLSDFKSGTGKDPLKYITAFYDYLKKSLHFDASCSQLKQKIRRLKEKFKANSDKKGKDPVFSKPHELKLFELSRKFWGNEVEEKGKQLPKMGKQSPSPGKNPLSSKNPPSLILSEMFWGFSGLNEDVVKKGVKLIEESEKARLEGRWRELQVAELELFAKRTELIKDQTRLILKAYKSFDHKD